MLISLILVVWTTCGLGLLIWFAWFVLNCGFGVLGCDCLVGLFVTFGVWFFCMFDDGFDGLLWWVLLHCGVWRLWVCGITCWLISVALRLFFVLFVKLCFWFGFDFWF